MLDSKSKPKPRWANKKDSKAIKDSKPGQSITEYDTFWTSITARKKEANPSTWFVK